MLYYIFVLYFVILWHKKKKLHKKDK